MHSVILTLTKKVKMIKKVAKQILLNKYKYTKEFT